MPKLLLLLLLASISLQIKLHNFSIKLFSSQFSIVNTLNNHVLAANPRPHSPWIRLGHGKLLEDPIKDGNNLLDERSTVQTHHQSVETIQGTKDKIEVFGKLWGGLWWTECKVAYNFTLIYVDQNQVKFEVGVDEDLQECKYQQPNRIYLSLNTPREEEIYGLGVQYSYWNLKGHKIPILVSEQGVGRGLQPITWYMNTKKNGAGGSHFTTYAPKPLYLTNSYNAFLLENSEISIFDLRDRHQVDIEIMTVNKVSGFFMSGENMLDLIETVTLHTGRMGAVPEWVLEGAIIGVEGGYDYVKTTVDKLIENDVPLVGVWIQDWPGDVTNWDGTRILWNWVLDQQLYHDWHQMFKNWKLRPLIYINPYLADTSNSHKNITRNLFQEAIQNNYFVMNSSNQPYLMQSLSITFGTVDLTNPAAFKWYKNVIKTEMIQKAGASGWMHDFGEYIPFDSVSLHASADSFHNVYPQEWARLAKEAVEESNCSGECMFFTRSAWTQSPKYTSTFWLGDQLVSWDKHDGIKTVLYGMFSGGLTGHSLTHSDIGGYTSVKDCYLHFCVNFSRTKELLMRWAELSSFMDVIYRGHPGSTPGLNWQVWNDTETMQHFGRFAKVHSSLKVYKQQLIKEATEKGYPMSRHMFLHYPECIHIEDQFLLGRDLLVAPVLDEHKHERKVQFPCKDEWVSIWDQQQIRGCKKHQQVQKVKVAAPIGKPPVYCRKGTFVCTLFKAFRD